MLATTTNKVKRSSIPAIRENMLEKGALLFCFERPKGITSSNPEDVTWFNQMEAAGFLVTKSGCIFPYENYSGASKGRPKGHKISALFFKGSMPTFPNNPHGWPTTTQVSHLCHRKQCINPNHMVYEPQWKNLKRNYCGDTGKCDCGVEPKCLATYHNDDWAHVDEFITYDTKRFKKLVKCHLLGLRYSIRLKDHFASVDKRTNQRNERLSKKRKAVEKSNSFEPPSKKRKRVKSQ
jgi:hypothetical protein